MRAEHAGARVEQNNFNMTFGFLSLQMISRVAGK
jgi:hypothetical protein